MEGTAPLPVQWYDAAQLLGGLYARRPRSAWWLLFFVGEVMPSFPFFLSPKENAESIRKGRVNDVPLSLQKQNKKTREEQVRPFKNS